MKKNTVLLHWPERDFNSMINNNSQVIYRFQFTWFCFYNHNPSFMSNAVFEWRNTFTVFYVESCQTLAVSKYPWSLIECMLPMIYLFSYFQHIKASTLLCTFIKGSNCHVSTEPCHKITVCCSSWHKVQQKGPRQMSLQCTQQLSVCP